MGEAGCAWTPSKPRGRLCEPDGQVVGGGLPVRGRRPSCKREFER